MAALGLCCGIQTPLCCVWVSSSCVERGYSLVVVHRLRVAAASLVAEHRVRGLQQLWHRGVVAPRPMESQFPDEGLAGKFLTGPPGKSPW